MWSSQAHQSRAWSGFESIWVPIINLTSIAVEKNLCKAINCDEETRQFSWLNSSKIDKSTIANQLLHFTNSVLWAKREHFFESRQFHWQTFADFFLMRKFFSLRYRLWIFSRKRWFLHAFQLSTSERLWCSWAGSFGGWKDCRSEFRNKNISSRIMMIGRRLKCLRGQKLTTLRQQKKEANCWVIMKTRPLNRFSCSASTPCGCLMTKAFFITTSTERKKILVSWEIKKYCLMTWLSDVRSKWPGSRRLVSLRLPRNSLGMKSRNRNE